MTKIKEKMLNWSRYSIETIIIMNSISIILLLLLLVKFLLPQSKEYVFLIGKILCVIGTMISIFNAMLVSFKGKSKIFIRKNSFGNIVLSNRDVIFGLQLELSIVLILLSIHYMLITLTIFASVIGVMSIYTSKKIAELYEKKLIK